MAAKHLEEKLEKASALIEQALSEFDGGRFKEAGTAVDSAHSLADEVLSELDEDSDGVEPLTNILSAMEDLGEADSWEADAAGDPDGLQATRSELAGVKEDLEALDLGENEDEES